MSIPCKMRPVGLDSPYMGYIRAEFLESTGTQWIDTGYNDRCTASLRYELLQAFNYNGSLSYKWGQRDALYNSRGTQWYVESTDLYFNLYACFDVAPCVVGQIYNIVHKLGDGNRSIVLAVDDVIKSAVMSGEYTPVSYRLFNFKGARERLYWCKLSALEQLKRDFIPSLDSAGVPCLFDLVTRKPFYNTETGSDFIVGMNTTQAPNLAILPAPGGSLTVSLPLAAVFDDKVQSALNTAADNGWTITVQYRESDLTAKNIDADFLESTGSQWIDTQYIPDNETGLLLDMLRRVAGDTMPFGCRNSNSTNTRFYALRAGSGASTGYGWGGWSILNDIAAALPRLSRYKTFTNWLNSRTVEIEQMYSSLAELAFVPTCPLFLFAANIGNNAELMFGGRIWEAGVSQGSEIVRRYIPAIDSSGVPCMYDTVSDQNFYNQGTGSFIVGFNTIKKAAISISQLPVTTNGELTVSLPLEAAFDDNMQRAMEIATARGWTIFVQYHESELTSDYIEADFLESTGTQYIQPSIKLNSDSDIYCDVYLTNRSSGTNIFGYREPLEGYINAGTYIVPAAIGYFINWRYDQRVTADTWAANTRYAIQQTNTQLIINGKKAASYNAPDDWSTSYTCRVFGSVNVPGAAAYFIGRFYSFTVKERGVDVINLIPTLDSTGTPCMYDTVTKTPFYNEITTGSDFVVGFDTTKKAAVSLSKLPVTTDGTLTVSLPLDVALDDNVQTALSIATNRGWTIIVQYRESELTTKNIDADFLETTGQQWLRLDDLHLGSTSDVNMKFAPTDMTSWFTLFYCMTNASYNRMGSIQQHRKIRYDSINEGFVYSSSELTVGSIYHVRQCGERNFLNGIEQASNKSSECYINAPTLIGKSPHSSTLSYMRIFEFKAASNINVNAIPVIDSSGVPCLYDTISDQNFYNANTAAGAAPFVAGFETTKKAAISLSKLPITTSGTLTVSLPQDAALVDNIVQEALRIAAARGWTIITQYRDEFEDESIRNKYASCTNRADVEAVNPDYRNDLTSDGEWVYPMPNMVSIARDPSPWFFRGSPMTEVDIELPKLTEAQYVFRNATKLKKARVSMPLVTNNQRSVFEDCPLEELYVYAPNLTYLQAFIIGAKLEELTEDMIVHGDITDLSYFGGKCPNLWRVALNLDYVTTIDYSFRVSPKLSSFECDLPSLINGEAAFANAILNKESALRILSTIPAHSSGTHNLGLGIHIDHQNDEEVLTAIANAEAKGWTLTVQWNGTPTSTASTMSIGTLIYAKLDEMERPDDTTERYLDWGHYVTDWEERGYEQFRSLESAYSYFNLETPENT